MPKMLSSMIPLAAAMAVAGPADAEAPAAPVRLVTEVVGDAVRIRVIGRSASALDARYALEVSGGAGGARNRSTQRGTVRLQPGVSVEMTSVTLGNVAGGGWTAKLTVEPAGAAAYEEVRTSAS